MKILIVLLPYLASGLAGDIAISGATPSPQRGLLVLPKPAPAAYPSNLNQYTANQQRIPDVLRPEFAERRGVYFVEVPEERIQALQGYIQQQTAQNIQASAAAQYNQEESFPVNVRYLPLEDSPSSQYREEPSEQTAVPVVRYLPVPLTEQSQQYKSQQSKSGQQAVLQYSEVEPIRGPVYSYSPSAITRILRYAPVY